MTTEKKKIPFKEKIIFSVLVVLVTLLSLSSLMESLESLFLKQRFALRGSRDLPAEVIVIGIDEKSLDHPQSGPWPWTRSTFAQFIYELEQVSPNSKVVAFEMLFENKSLRDEPGDDALVYRTEEFRNPIILGYFLEQSYRSRFDRASKSHELLQRFEIKHIESLPSKLVEFSKLSLPYEELANQSSLGFLNLNSPQHRDDGAIQMIGKYRGKIYPSFELESVLAYLDTNVNHVKIFKNKIRIEKPKHDSYEIPITSEGYMLLNFYGKMEDFKKNYVSFVDISQASLTLPTSKLRDIQKKLSGKMFLIGRTAPSIKDDKKTPFSDNESTIFIRAQAIANVLDGSSIKRVPVWADILLLLFLSFSVFLLMQKYTEKKSGFLLIAFLFIFFLISQLLFYFSIWIPFVFPCVSSILVYLSVATYRYFAALEELKKTQLQLIHSAKMATIGQVSANMAHEFRNIMHAVKLHVEACARPGMKPERVQKYMGVIFKTMTNAEQILNGILTFSRKNQSELKMGDLEKTIQDTLLLLKREFEYQNIQVSLQLEKVSPCAFDAGQISQVVMNLMNNARDALKEQKEKLIMISLKEDEKMIYLDLADNGPGIPKKVMENLFKEFVTTKAEGKGTGLGLSMCKKIIANHGGDIYPKSVAGQGTVWRISLPKGSHES